MRSHRYAECYPIDPVLVAQIAKDMAENGFDRSHPIVRDKLTDLVVDGRTRHSACERAGVDPVFDDRYFKNDQEIADYIRRANDQRRGNMTNYQRMVHAILWAKAAGEPEPTGSALKQASGYTQHSKLARALEVYRAGGEQHDLCWNQGAALPSPPRATKPKPEPEPDRSFVDKPPKRNVMRVHGDASPMTCGVRHMVIPDTQVSPGVPLVHFVWLAKYAAEHRPDLIIHLGDHYDLSSLSHYDLGTTRIEGKRLANDIAAGKLALKIFSDTLRKEAPDYAPARHMLTGNHEQRLRRHVEANPALEGQLSYEDLGREEFGWTTHDFLDPITIDGIRYCHYFVRNAHGRVMQSRRGMPSAKAQVVREGVTSIAGHMQGLDVHVQVYQDCQRWGVIAGSCYLHDEDYLTGQGTQYWRGCLVLNDVHDGEFSPWFVDLNYLCRRYEGVTLKEFLTSAKDSQLMVAP